MARYGMAIGGDLAGLGALARRCEDAGFESLWVPETARTAVVQAAVVIDATQRVRVGTGIALAFPRSPVMTAMAARDLAELSGGRFVLGLGTQVKRVNEHRFATPFEHPAPKMREVIEVCRAVWASYAGEPIDHRGRFYTVTLPPFPGAGPAPGPIPVCVAGVNEGMLRLAGEICDGLIGHPFTSLRYIAEVVRPALAAGAAVAARDPGACELIQSVIVAVSDDVRAAREAVKLQIAFYGTTRTYRPVFALHGWGDVVEPLREAHAAGDLDGMRTCITDEMADTFAVAGTAEDVAARLTAYEDACDTIVLNPPWVLPDDARGPEVYAGLIAAVARRSG